MPKLKSLKKKLVEGNTYAYLQEEGYKFLPLVGREVYTVSLWRLVLGREHGEPVFELIMDLSGASPSDVRETVEDYVKEEGITLLDFTDEEFEEVTGTPLGQACFDG